MIAIRSCLLTVAPLKDDDWKTIEDRIFKDIDCKVDRLEFKPIKDELEKQLRNILRQLKLIDRGNTANIFHLLST